MSKPSIEVSPPRSDHARSRRLWIWLGASWFVGTVVYVLAGQAHPFAAGFKPPASDQSRSRAGESAPDPTAIRTFVTREPSLGVTEADLTPEALVNLERGVVVSMERNSKAAAVDFGIDPDTFDGTFESASAYVDTEGTRLAIVRVSAPGLANSVVILGVRGSELVRVTCLRAGPEQIPIWSGSCGQTVKATFNVGIGP